MMRLQIKKLLQLHLEIKRSYYNNLYKPTASTAYHLAGDSKGSSSVNTIYIWFDILIIFIF
jgi:hypothetical protein